MNMKSRLLDVLESVKTKGGWTPPPLHEPLRMKRHESLRYRGGGGLSLEIGP